MWIRSQNEELLIKATCVYLSSENHICAYAPNTGGDNWYIGKYSTKEKALKVLDMIQKRINRAFMYDYQPGLVFQMPQDDEVEACKKITASVVLKYQKEAKKVTVAIEGFERLGRELCDIYGLTDKEAIDILNNNNVLEILRKYEEVE
jgi:hypothetical protein